MDLSGLGGREMYKCSDSSVEEGGKGHCRQNRSL